MLGVTIDNPAVIALAAKALQSELMGGSPILVMTKGFESRVDVLASVPHAMIDTLSDKMPRAKAWLRGIGRASGAGSHVFLIVSDADYDNRKDVLRHLVSAGLLTDVVSPGGKSIMLHEYVPYHGKKLFDDRRHGHKVAESLADDLEAQEKYLTDGAKKLGYESIDDLAVNDYDAFERLAAQWRMDHPVETALYQPVAEYGGPFKAPEVRNAAGELLAPNGEPSKLTDGQWHQVRSPAFKEWFGDWERLAKTIDPVTLVLEGWTGSKEDLRLLAQGWYSENLQGKPPTINEDMGVPVMFASEGKSTAFATSGNLRTGWKAEMVRALPELVQRAIKVQEVAPDARRLRDTQMFHTLVAPLSVAGKTYSAKITIREALERVASAPHKFYDIAALEINNGPEVYGLKDSEHVQNPLPTPSEPLGMTIRQLASAVNGLDFESGVSKVVDENGEPKVLYHGTTRDIDRYDPKTDQRLPGFWMAPTPELANTYAAGGVVNPRGYPSGANVVPVFVKAEKLRVFDGRKESMMHVWDAYQNGDFNGFVELGFTGDVYAYSVKKPTQIKSAIGNNGAFDGTNPIMTKAQPRIIFFKKAKA